MGTQATVALAVALGLTLVAGSARADGPGAAYGGQEVGTIRYLDRAQNLVVLTDGNEFYAPDGRMLTGLREGDTVLVDFTHDTDRSTLHSIEPVAPGSHPGVSPGSEPGNHFHG